MSEGWKARAEAAEVDLREERVNFELMKERAEEAEAALAKREGNYAISLMESLGMQNQKLLDAMDALRHRAQAAEARAHELSIKYVVALNRVKELEEKLK